MKPRRRSRPNSIGGQFAAHPIDMMENPAWRALSLSARRCLERIEIELANHGGRDNGQLPVTNRNFCAYGVWMGAIKPALAELVTLGFIEMTPGYACANPLYGRAARFRLLFRTGRDGPPEEHRWRRFGTDGEAKAAAVALLDRGYGRPGLAVELTGEQAGPVSVLEADPLEIIQSRLAVIRERLRGEGHPLLIE